MSEVLVQVQLSCYENRTMRLNRNILTAKVSIYMTIFVLELYLFLIFYFKPIMSIQFLFLSFCGYLMYLISNIAAIPKKFRPCIQCCWCYRCGLCVPSLEEGLILLSFAKKNCLSKGCRSPVTH